MSDLKLYRHKKTGGFYALLTDEARLEWEGTDGERMCVYLSLDDDRTWIRPVSEFFDGRFLRDGSVSNDGEVSFHD